MSSCHSSSNRPRFVSSSCAAIAILAASAPSLVSAQVWGQPTQQYQYQSATSSVPSNWLSKAIAPEERTHDFGTVARAAKTEHRFVITNTSGRDMHLRSVRASCGCTTPIIETQDVIKPGEQGTILARFNTGTFTGRKKATLTVTIDQPYLTELQLNVGGYIRSDVVVNPGSVMFGDVSEGEAKEIEVTVDYAGRNDWRIEGVDSNSKFITTSFEEKSRGGGRVAYTVRAEISADAPRGLLRDQLVLRTNDRRLTTVPVELTAEVRSPIQLSPKEFALGTVKKQESISQRLVIKGKKPFKILEITSPHAEIRFDPIEEPKPAHLVNIELEPTSIGEIAGKILVRTDLSDEPLKLNLSYFVDGPTVPTSTSVSPD
ncbi:MAG: DUF1573 domain-containing protein [Aureliella sp.]